MEDSGMPLLLRNVQVGAIWEGTTNVLSLDVWRPISSEGAFQLYHKRVLEKIANSRPSLKPAVEAVQKGLKELSNFVERVLSGQANFEIISAQSRQFAYG